jgi:DnaJ-class molecular chaperone
VNASGPGGLRLDPEMAMDHQDNIDKVGCAFCKGKGVDPFGLLSRDSVCQVCNGSGHHLVVKPHQVCAYCHGHGVEFGTRNTCLSCGGKGCVSVKKNCAVCAVCHGSGMNHESGLRCTSCGGAGVK